jgi:SMI1-KNR4 cell-wall
MHPDENSLERNSRYTGTPVTDAVLAAADRTLGHRLPESYKRLLSASGVNGGVPVRTRCMTTFATSWAEDHFEVSALFGVGDAPSALDSALGSAYLVEQWDYPPVGVVICDTPSAGHDTLMLDYRACGPEGEPSVVYVDEDREPRRVAGSFAEFFASLVT